MKKNTFLLIGAYVTGLAAIGLLILLALPLVAFGSWRPFDNPLICWISTAVVSLGALGHLGYTLYKRAKQEKELAAGMTAAGSGDDTRHLQKGMEDALAVLKKSAGKKKGDYVYDLPWYIIIGHSGTGKTQALVNSGLNFPLAKSKVAGAGGTRYCDWWFTDDAVLIDTAGRYTTQATDAPSDSQSWLSFLRLLKRSRPKQPINGALVCISVKDLLTLSPDKLNDQADALRDRLTELHENLQVDFPVYVVFTMADLIAGFMEFFGHLPEQQRRVVWGATFQGADRTTNMVTETPVELDALIEHLNQMLVDRLQEEPDPAARVKIFGFPSQVAALRKPIYAFLARVFEPNRYHAKATLRGFYFTSGMQEGTPFDQLIGALARGFGVEKAAEKRYSGQGRSFFLNKLLSEVIFGEAGWVSTNRGAATRSFALKVAGYSLVGVLCAGFAGAWAVSYQQNNQLIRDVRRQVAQHAGSQGSLDKETKISDHNFLRILPALDELAGMPAGYLRRNDPIPLGETFGLSQRPYLTEEEALAYHRALYRLMRPRLMHRMEERLREHLSDPGFLTAALPVYLMMDTWPVDAQRVTDWWLSDWADNLLPGPEHERARASLEMHLKNLIALGPRVGVDVLDIDHKLVEEARKAIARTSVADRAFAYMRSTSRSTGYWSVAGKAGSDANLVFEGVNGTPLDRIRVPYFFTQAGFREDFLGRLDQISKRVREEDGRLLADMARQQVLARQYDNLRADLIARYQQEFIQAWRHALGQLHIRLLTADKPRYEALKVAAGPTSPIMQLAESIRAETKLTDDKAPQPQQDGKQPAPDAKAQADRKVAGALVDDQFRAFHQLVEGPQGQRPVDELLHGLNQVYAALVMLNDPTRMTEGQAKFRDALHSVEATATRFPDPFRAMIQSAVGAFDSDATGTTVARIQQTLAEQVTRVCEQVVAGKYPFKQASLQDLPIDDFQRLFRPSGIIDRFYTANLAQLIDTSRSPWVWNAANALARQMPETSG